MVKAIDVSDVLWNASRTENTVIDGMLERREKVKGKFQACNNLYITMKKQNYPLNKAERDKYFQ